MLANPLLSTFQQNVYLITVACSVAATGLLIAPVSLHRLLFRQHARRVMVRAAHLSALAGLLLLSLAIVGVTLLIFDVVRGPPAGWTAAAATLCLLSTLWLTIPLLLRLHVTRSE